MRIYVLDENENAAGDVLWLAEYHPKRGGSNPKFDAWSKHILDLKYNRVEEVEFFFQRVDPLLAPGISIAVVPGHEPIKPGQPPSARLLLARRLAAAGRADATGCLVRTQATAKLARGGDRSIAKHLQTIAVESRHLISGKTVLLFDDVTTTHNSFTACRQLLLRNGAARVKCLALGRTARDPMVSV